MSYLEHTVRDGRIQQGHADGHAVQLALQLREYRGNRRCRPGRGRGEVKHARAAAPQILKHNAGDTVICVSPEHHRGSR